jgi:serine/threonine protein kinase
MLVITFDNGKYTLKNVNVSVHKKFALFLDHPCFFHQCIETSDHCLTVSVSGELLSLRYLVGRHDDVAQLSNLMIGQLSHALKHLHQNQLVLRNLNPDLIFYHNNVFVIVDFSHACFIGPFDQKYVLDRTICNYQAPEVYNYKLYVPKSDVFCLGLVAVGFVQKNFDWNVTSVPEFWNLAIQQAPDKFKDMLLLDHSERISSLNLCSSFCQLYNQGSEYFSLQSHQNFECVLYQALNSDALCDNLFQFCLPINLCLVLNAIPALLVKISNPMTHLHGQYRHTLKNVVSSFLHFSNLIKSSDFSVNIFACVSTNEVENLHNFLLFCTEVDLDIAILLIDDAVSVNLLCVDKTFITSVFQSSFEVSHKVLLLKSLLKFVKSQKMLKLLSLMISDLEKMNQIIQDQHAKMQSEQESLKKENKRLMERLNAVQEENEKLRKHFKAMHEVAKTIELN